MRIYDLQLNNVVWYVRHALVIDENRADRLRARPVGRIASLRENQDLEGGAHKWCIFGGLWTPINNGLTGRR